MSGHNKWSKIKRQKEKTDAQKSKIFGKMVRVISVEAKKAGGNLSAPGLRTAVEKRGTPLGPYDMMIAAQSLSLGLILVTDNEREFRRVKSLQVENWRDRRD